jgi:hypothetical protein
MVFGDADNTPSDQFGTHLLQWCERMSGQEDYGVFTVDEATLRSMNESEVITLNNYLGIYYRREGTVQEFPS